VHGTTDEPDNSQLARDAALRLLARREHSRLELTQKLRLRGFNPPVIAELIEALAAENLQSEERFTEMFVHARRERGRGPVRIRVELGQRGVPELLMDAWVDLRDPVWTELARQSCLKRFGEAPPEDWPEKAKRMRFLQARGFTTDQIRDVVE
jgi:regulatory protein